jgi:hypothetical protein
MSWQPVQIINSNHTRVLLLLLVKVKCHDTRDAIVQTLAHGH